MWPRHLDLDPEECAGILRRLELDAYSGVVSALRAQGDLTKERRKILSDLSSVLNVSVERHKTEVRRAVNDETLATVARCVAGPNCENDWAREGRRIVPLMRRAVPVTALTPRADAAKRRVEERNASLPAPLHTRTPKRRQRQDSRGRDAPTPLRDAVVENGASAGAPGAVSAPARGGKWGWPADPNDLGDIVILPSGTAVRFKEEPPSSPEKGNKPSSSGPDASGEESAGQQKQTPKRGNKRRKRTQDSDQVPDVKGSIEVVPPGMLFPNAPPTAPFFPPQQSGPAQPPGGLRFSYYPPANMGPPPLPPGGLPRTPQPATKRRRSSKAKSIAAALAAAAQGGLPPPPHPHPPHLLNQPPSGVARPPFLPKSPSPLHELEGKVPNMTFAHPLPPTTVAAGQKIPGVGATMPELPRVPVSVSPSKINQVIQRAVAASSSTSAASTAGAEAGSNGKRRASPSPQQQQQAALNSPVTPTTAIKTLVTTTVDSTASPSSSPVTSPPLMKIIPAGAATRILPKPVVTGGVASAGAPPAGTPVYVVATSSAAAAANAAGMRLTRTSLPAASLAASGAAQRVVTVSTAALKAAQQGHAGSAGTVAAAAALGLRPTTMVRALTPTRTFASAASPGSAVGAAAGRPSVIVVQRTAPVGAAKVGGAVGSGMAAALSGQRLLQTKGGKPVVIVSKPTLAAAAAAGSIGGTPEGVPSSVPAPVFVPQGGLEQQQQASSVRPAQAQPEAPAATAEATTAATTDDSSTAKDSASQQGGNVIVLDLSQDQLTKSNVLSDILQVTGILPNQQQQQQEQQPPEAESSAPAPEATAAADDGDQQQTPSQEAAAGSEQRLPSQGGDEGEQAESNNGTAVNSHDHEATEDSARPEEAEEEQRRQEQQHTQQPLHATESEEAANAEVPMETETEAQTEAETAAAIKAKQKLATVVPPCANPEDVMLTAAKAASAPASAEEGEASAGGAPANNGTADGGGGEEGESLDDISSFIQETSQEVASK